MYLPKNNLCVTKTIVPFLILSVFILLLTGCKKEDDPGVTTEISVKSRLVGKWKVESLLLDDKETVKDCGESKTYEFTADDKVIYTVKPCNSTTESSDEYSYVVSADGKTFTINLVDPPNTLFDTPRTILELTETTLRFTYTNPNGTYKGTFTK